MVELGKQLLAAARDGDTEGVRGLMARGAPFTAGINIFINKIIASINILKN